jgi:hypothetical protein
MTPQPALFKILDLVVTAMQGTVGYGAPNSSATQPVFDGPIIGQDAPLNYMCIGWTPTGDTAGTIRTMPGVFGTRADLLEEGTFDAVVVASSGDTPPATVRASLRTMVADLQTAVYGLTDTSFAGYWCEVSNLDYRQIQSMSGVTCEATVTFTYRVQLGA